MTVVDSINILADKQTVWSAITEADKLEKWWPESAEIDLSIDGKIVFNWFSGSRTETTISDMELYTQLSFPFGNEFLSLYLEEQEESTRVEVVHSNINDENKDLIIHIAQSWRLLLINLKVFLEDSKDLRPAIGE